MPPSYQRKIFSLVVLGVIALLGSSQSRAAVDYCQIIDVSGRAEILETGSVRWTPLLAPKFLKGGDKIRTADKSYAEISTSPDLSGLLKLGANSQLEVMGEDLARFFLYRGLLLVLREEDSNVPGRHRREEVLFQIFTPDMTACLLKGGCSVSVSDKGSWVRVFSEHVRVGKKTVPEGFKYFIGKAGAVGPLGPSRMHYTDYTEWQFWMRSCYERKDTRADDFLTKK